MEGSSEGDSSQEEERTEKLEGLLYICAVRNITLCVCVLGTYLWSK